jgi:RNA polymerase sigma-70 factor (ECF subfamily)
METVSLHKGRTDMTTEHSWRTLRSDLRTFVRRRVRRESDAEDLVQRLLTHLLQGVPRLRNEDRLRPWAFKAARHAVIDYYRAQARCREEAAGASGDLPDVRTAEAADARQPLRDLAACLPAVMHGLSAPDQAALRTVDLDGHPQSSLAAAHGLSQSGAKSRVQRARRHLKAAFERCCRIQIGSRGDIIAYEPRATAGCACAREACGCAA